MGVSVVIEWCVRPFLSRYQSSVLLNSGQRGVIGVVGRHRADEAVAALGAIDRPASGDGIAGGGKGFQDRRAENRVPARGGFVKVEAGRYILHRKGLAPRHIRVGFMQVDGQAIGTGKLVEQILDRRDFRQPGSLAEGPVQVGAAAGVAHTAGEGRRG